jgi:hypothetical protein
VREEKRMEQLLNVGAAEGNEAVGEELISTAPQGCGYTAEEIRLRVRS